MSVTIDQAAALLHRSRRTVYLRIKHGELETVHVGASTRVTKASLAHQPEFVPHASLESVLKPAIKHPYRISYNATRSKPTIAMKQMAQQVQAAVQKARQLLALCEANRTIARELRERCRLVTERCKALKVCLAPPVKHWKNAAS